jgi:UDP-2,3-diacylglucosamine hydrolase
MPRLGIIAGSGALPRTLVQACLRDGRDFFVLGFRGQTDDGMMNGVPHGWSKLGATNAAIDILKQNNVDTLVMAGAIRRPSLREMRPDLRTLKVFARLGAAAFGDDALLRAVVAELEKEGFGIVGAHDIEPALITPAGVLGAVQPGEQNGIDRDFGIRVTRTLGALDVGQAAVVQQGIVIGIEAVEGTDNLLARCRKHRRMGIGGVLVKSCKPQQDRRVDLPTVGLRTLRRAYEAGLSGIAIEAGASILLDREEVVSAADRLGLFIEGFGA